MRRLRWLASRWTGREWRRSAPWRCQLVYVETLPDALVIDLVALDDCPATGIGCPRHSPFSIRIARPVGPREGWDRPAGEWAVGTDEVTITCGIGDDGASWMCLSGASGDLVLQA